LTALDIQSQSAVRRKVCRIIDGVRDGSLHDPIVIRDSSAILKAGRFVDHHFVIAVWRLKQAESAA
jgi:hypothetical protein